MDVSAFLPGTAPPSGHTLIRSLEEASEVGMGASPPSPPTWVPPLSGILGMRGASPDADSGVPGPGGESSALEETNLQTGVFPLLSLN